MPYALGGLATVENISLRCRRHNQYEAELVFGPRSFPEARGTVEAVASAATNFRLDCDGASSTSRPLGPPGS
ncbi:MAG: hypothetical protein DMF77_24680 [Acidobacteria bacterium]|nr:MAG: hypothetical protein DMF77_24680 [Acidobacteriota bacterium]